MEQTIAPILNKLSYLHYLAQDKKNIQVIRLIVKKEHWLTPTDRNALIGYVQSKLSIKTEVVDFRPDDLNMTIYISVPENENLEPLKKLRENFFLAP